jgi:hypothetical protein
MRALLTIIIILIPVSLFAQNPVAYWPLDESSGDAIIDLSGNELHGLASGASIAAGLQGMSRTFNGTNAYLEVPDNNLLDITEAITIMLWVRFEPPAHEGFLISKRVEDDINCSINYGIKSFVDTDSSYLSFQYGTGCDTGCNYLIENIPDLDDGGWHHIALAFRYGEPAGAVWMVDGDVIPGTWIYWDGTPGGGTEMPPVNDHPLEMGRQLSSSPGYFHGSLDQVRLYDQVLSEIQITDIYEREQSNPIALLVQNADTLDAEEAAAHTFARIHGFGVALIDPAMILADETVLDDVDAFWAANNSEPTTFDNTTVAEALRSRIDNGRGMMVTWYGHYLIQYMGLGTASAGSPWSPAVSDHQYWVDAISEHAMFDEMTDWIPPSGPPDDETKLLYYVTPGYIPMGRIDINWWVPAYQYGYAHLWASYGWCGQTIDDYLCSLYGITCTCQRGVHQSYITEARVNLGVIMVGPIAMAGGDHWNWAPAGHELLADMFDYLRGGSYRPKDSDILLYTTRDYGDAGGICRRGAYDEDLPEILDRWGFHLMPHDRETMPALTSSILAYYDQLWFVSTEDDSVLSPDEIAAFHEFHFDGKGILVITDSQTYDGPANVVSEPYGVSFSGEMNHCGGGVGCPIATNEFAVPYIFLWSNADYIEGNLNEGHITASAPARVVAAHNGINMIATYDADVGGGRIAWDATYYRFSDESAHADISIKHYDNEQYVLNLATWLDFPTPVADDIHAMRSLPFELEQNYPNPFNPLTMIGFYLPEDCNVTLDVYDVAGRKIAVLLDGMKAAGSHAIHWEGRNATGDPVSSGVYFYRLTADGESVTKKMILLR